MTLTEQWKNDKLQNDWYYVRTTNGIEKLEYIKQSHGFGYYETEWVLEVLAPVPSYDRVCRLNHLENDFIKTHERINKLEKENQQLKTQITKLTEIVGVLPSNHSVGNLGYKIKNQRHEINNRLKEIDKLKDLLKECREEISDEIDDCTDPRIELFAKIDNAIGEK